MLSRGNSRRGESGMRELIGSRRNCCDETDDETASYLVGRRVGGNAIGLGCGNIEKPVMASLR